MRDWILVLAGAVYILLLASQLASMGSFGELAKSNLVVALLIVLASVAVGIVSIRAATRLVRRRNRDRGS